MKGNEEMGVSGCKGTLNLFFSPCVGGWESFCFSALGGGEQKIVERWETGQDMVLAKPHGPDPPANSFLRSNRVKDRKIKKTGTLLAVYLAWPLAGASKLHMTSKDPGPRLSSRVCDPRVFLMMDQWTKGSSQSPKKIILEVACSVTSNSFATPWAVAHQAPLSMGFSRQEYWSGLPISTPEALPNLEIELESPASPALAVRFFTTVSPGKPLSWSSG